VSYHVLDNEMREDYMIGVTADDGQDLSTYFGDRQLSQRYYAIQGKHKK
jgi:hypothetical protein